MGSKLKKGSKTISENISDQYDPTELSVAISMAARLQADAIAEGGALTVKLPNSDETIELNIVEVGKIDPDILAADQMTNPEEQDSSPMPGFVVDTSPLFGGEEGHYSAITLDTNAMRLLASPEALESYGVSAEDAAAYRGLAVNGEVVGMQIKEVSNLPEVFPATAAELESVGMDMAAQNVKSSMEGDAPASTQELNQGMQP